MSAIVRVLPSGHEFVVEHDEPLLQAALRSGLAVEFGCTNGSCGECRARVTRGAVRRIRFHDYVIREADKRAGVALLCCCTADEDVTIEAGEARGPDDIPVQTVRARLYRQERVGDDTIVVYLRVMRGRALRFLSGQHARVEVAGCAPEDLSIASCPCDGLNLELHLGPNDGGALAARARDGFRKSDRFEIEGPRGHFVLDEDSPRPLLFLACETAIAPIKSIVEHAINLELSQSMYLYWYVRARGGHYLHNYFRSLDDALDEFAYVPVAGDMQEQPPGEPSDLGAADIYIAGDEAFAGTARNVLLARGAPEERVFIDALSRRPGRKAD